MSEKIRSTGSRRSDKNESHREGEYIPMSSSTSQRKGFRDNSEMGRLEEGPKRMAVAERL